MWSGSVIITNIYVDFLEERVAWTGRKLGNEAWEVFFRVLKGEYTLIVSDHLDRQLEKHLSKKGKAAELFLLIKKHVVKVYTEPADKTEAERILQPPGDFEDALHVILAKKGGARILVTQNISDFLPYSNYIEPNMPSQLVKKL